MRDRSPKELLDAIDELRYYFFALWWCSPCDYEQAIDDAITQAAKDQNEWEEVDRYV